MRVGEDGLRFIMGLQIMYGVRNVSQLCLAQVDIQEMITFNSKTTR